MFLPHLYLITCPFGVMLLPLRIYVLSELGSVKWLEVLVRYNVPSDSGRQGQIRGYEIGGKGVNWKIGDRGSIVRIWHREWRIMISDWQVSNTLFFFFLSIPLDYTCFLTGIKIGQHLTHEHVNGTTTTYHPHQRCCIYHSFLPYG